MFNIDIRGTLALNLTLCHISLEWVIPTYIFMWDYNYFYVYLQGIILHC